ncbi:MAG: hypothetical protein ACRC5V_10100 [Aeromonas sp.]
MIAAEPKTTGQYQAYPEYKDSGVEWWGNIPAGWHVNKLKYLASLVTKKASNRIYPIGLENIESWTGLFLPSDSEFQGEGIEFVNGDILFGKLRPYLAKVMLAGSVGEAVGDFHVIRPVDDVVSRYLQYQLLTKEFISVVDGSTFGAKMPRVSWEFMADLVCAQPSKDEAISIATFLDYETARIDQLITLQQRLIELLKEKRQAVISHAVRTRPSEGHIKLAYAINLLTGYPFASSGFKSTKDTHIPLLRGTNVGVDQIKWDDVVYWDSEDCSHLDDYYLECGDIVFGMDRPWISSGARVAEITQHDTPCLLLQRVARIRAKANHFQTYIKLCLSSNEFRNYVEADLTGVSVPHISPDQITGFLIRNIPYDEQVSVTKEVLQALEKLNAVEKAAFNAIELLQERRTALISAAVTGKIDLRSWTPPAEEAAA